MNNDARMSGPPSRYPVPITRQLDPRVLGSLSTPNRSINTGGVMLMKIPKTKIKRTNLDKRNSRTSKRKKNPKISAIYLNVAYPLKTQTKQPRLTETKCQKKVEKREKTLRS